MTNLTKFLHAIAEGLSEQFEAMEAREGETTESLALRDYFSQLVAVAESVGPDGRADWSALDDRIGIDLESEAEAGALPVFVVKAPMRVDGLYLFADHGAAGAFADAVTPSDSPSQVGVEDPPVNVGAGAEQLIANERAALMEDVGQPDIAEDVREGKAALSAILALLSSIPDTTEARALVGHWIEVDEARACPAPCEAEPAYTVFGIYLEESGPHDGSGDRLQNYATTVYTHNGPDAAASIAQRVCREDNDAETGEDLLQIVAVIAGEHDCLDT